LQTITGSTTNTSSAASCSVVGACNYDITDTRVNPILTCTLGWNFAGTGERIQMVHIHWKAFTPPTGPAVAADKFVFNLGGGLDTDNGQTFVTATAISADFKAVIRYYSTLVSQVGIYGLYANFHSQWSPPSPFGAMAGRLQVATGSGTLPVSPDQGSLVLLPSNTACNVVTERVSYRLQSHKCSHLCLSGHYGIEHQHKHFGHLLRGVLLLLDK
jgi:hypothetical protein